MIILSRHLKVDIDKKREEKQTEAKEYKLL